MHVKTPKRFFRLFFPLLVCVVVFPAPVQAVSLDTLLQLAVENDARLKAETLTAQAKTADGWQAVAGYGPVVSGYGEYRRSHETAEAEESAELEDRSASYYEKELSIELKQPLIDFEKGSIAMGGMAEMDIAGFEAKKAFEDLLLRVHERYYDVLSSQQNHFLAAKESQALLDQLETTKAKLELGFGTITDQHNAEARYRMALATELARKTELDNAIKALEEVINQPLAENVDDLPEDAPLPELRLSVQEWLEVARNHNSDLNIKKLQQKKAEFTQHAAESRFLPALVFFADYTENEPDGGLRGYGEETSEGRVGLRLEGNLLSGGSDTAATVAASKRAKAARKQLEVSDRALFRSVYSLWNTIADTRTLIDAYQQAVEANRLAMESTQLSYDEGAKVLLDVLNAQQDFFRSLREYKTTRYHYMVLLAQFKQVIGVDEVITAIEPEREADEATAHPLITSAAGKTAEETL